VPFGKQPIQEGLITATDHPALGCGRGRGPAGTAEPSTDRFWWWTDLL